MSRDTDAGAPGSNAGRPVQITGSELPRLQLRLLGSFGAFLEGSGTVLRISSRKGRALLAYLAMQPDLQATRSELADLLWCDRVDAQARQSLRQCLVQLRRELAPLGEDLLEIDGPVVRLAKGRVTADAREFEALASPLEAAAEAAGLYRNEFLAGPAIDVEPFDAWAGQERLRLAGLAARVFGVAAMEADGNGNGEQAVAFAERLTRLDPLREDAQRLLLQMLARHRGRDVALVQARELEKLLRDELDVAPSAETAALIADIRNGVIGGEFAARQAARQPPVTDLAGTGPSASAGMARTALLPAASVPDGAIVAAMLAPSQRRQSMARLGVVLGSVLVAGLLAHAVLEPWPWIGPAPKVAGEAPAAIGEEEAPRDPWRSPQIFSGSAADPAKLAARGLFPMVVLPFRAEAGAGTPEERLADRLSADLINELSRVPTIRVIARQTSQLYRGREVDVAAIGAELGVRYVIDGSLRLEGPLMHIEVSLVEAPTRLLVWTERLQRPKSERMAISEEIMRGLARRLQLGVTHAAGLPAERTAPVDASTEALLARGWSILFRSRGIGSAEGAEQAFQEVLRRQPRNGSALTGLAGFHVIEVGNFAVPNREQSLALAEELLGRALADSSNRPAAHYFLGVVHRLRGSLDLALERLQEALELNPSLASAYAQLGHVLARLERAQEGLRHIDYALRLSPKDPSSGLWRTFAGLARLSMGEDEAAIAAIGEAVAFSPRLPLAHAAMASALALKGDLAGAQRHGQEFRRLAPAVTLDSLSSWFSSKPGESDSARRFLKGLRLALEGSA